MIAATAEPWSGSIEVRVGATEQTLRQKAVMNEPAGLGQTLTEFDAGMPGEWDETTALIISAPGEELSSADEASVLDGANRLLVERSDGWELLAWRSSELIATNQWRLTGLLRGLNQTAARSGAAGMTVIVADDRLVHVPLNAEQVGMPLLWQVGAAASVSFTYQRTAENSASDTD